MDELITTKQVQELLQVDRITVYRMLKDGRLNGVKVGKQWRFHQNEIEHLISSGTHTKVLSTPEYTPNEVLPAHCIQAIQDVFAEMNGIGVVTTDIEGTPVTEISNLCRFCQLVQSSPAGQQACYDSWQELALIPGNQAEYMECHAGLMCARAPIELHGELTAIVVAGQFVSDDLQDEELISLVNETAQNCEVDRSELQDAAGSIYRLDAARQSQVGRWLIRVAETFQVIAHERADLLGRLKNIAAMSTFKI